VNGRAILLHSHVVPTAQDLAISRDETCPDGHAAFARAFLGFFEGCLETCVGFRHVGWVRCMENRLGKERGFTWDWEFILLD
jgi:hypothetical protein